MEQNNPFSNMSPIDQLRLLMELRNNQQVSPEQAAANRAQTGYDALSMIPGPGNVISGYEAVKSGGAAADAFERGDIGSGAINSGMTALNALGAVLGLPVGRLARGAARGASSRTNVFVPVGEKEASDVIGQIEKGVPNSEIFQNTGKFVGPEGMVKREISDAPMLVRTHRFKEGDSRQLSDVISHPELFREMPNLRNERVRFTNAVDNRGNPITRTNPVTGSIELSAVPDPKIKGALARLLQYRISEMTGQSRATRHGPNKIDADLDEAARKAMESYSPEAGAYIRAILDERNLLRENMAKYGDRSAGIRANNRMAGNVEARAVKARAESPDDVSQIYPFARQAKLWGRTGSETRIGRFQDMLPIPPGDMSPGDVSEWLRRWQRYGSGKPEFKDGGSVGREPVPVVKDLAVGAVDGGHGGREDTRSVTLPENGYVIPADIVSALGDGNTKAGFEKLVRQFPAHKRSNFQRGGGVKASVSDGEFVVSPDHIAKIGGGDLATGHDALDSFVKKIRQHNINKLMNLPDPKQ